MNVLDLFRATFKAAKEEGIVIDSVTPATTAEEALNAAIPPDPRIAELTAALTALQATARRGAAEAWADSQIVARRATVGERPSLIAQHVQAAEDDAAHPAATPRIATLAATLAARTPHQWSSEAVPVAVLPMGANPDAAGRRKDLLNLTPLGRKVLAKENSHAN